jgi:hypothetical protein
MLNANISLREAVDATTYVVDMLKKYSGSDSAMSTEVWLCDTDGSGISVRRLTGVEVNVVVNFMGTATLKFDTEHCDTYLDCPESLISWEKWKEVFCSCYSHSATASAAEADWATIKQGPKELPSGRSYWPMILEGCFKSSATARGKRQREATGFTRTRCS